MAVGELLLSAFFQVLFDRLASRDLLNFVLRLQGGVYLELEKWKDALMMIQAVLRDAEEKQTNEAVNIWLDKLTDLAYDAEDILDEFSTEALKLKHKLVTEPDEEDSTSKVQNIRPCAWYNCFTPSTIKFSASMGSKIKDITSRLEQLCKQRIELGLQSTPGGSSSTAAQRRPPSSSVPTERAVYGRSEDKASILEMVSSTDANFQVITIVGMAGIGKTTLVREVYNDKAVDDFQFDIKAWVCVSEEFDVLTLSKAILESITFVACDVENLNEVQVQLKRTIDGKKFLLVLDDVWNEEFSLWEALKAPFMASAPASKILVTTRHIKVASIMATAEPYNLKFLQDDPCWSLFVDHAFQNRNQIDENKISEFRKKVVEKCGGLPLAAKTLGFFLRANHRDKLSEFIIAGKTTDSEDDIEELT